MRLFVRKRFYFVIIPLILVLIVGFLLFTNNDANADNGNGITQQGEDNFAVLPQSFADKLEKAVVLYTDSPVAFVNNEQTLIDTERPAARPVVINGRTLIPVKFVANAFESEYSFDEVRKTAKITAGKDIITFNAGESSIYKNDIKTATDAAPIEIDNILYIPLRSFANALNKFTFYDRGLIVISDTENILDAVKDKETINSLIVKTNNLPTIGTKENLYALVGNPKDYDLYLNNPEFAFGAASVPSAAFNDGAIPQATAAPVNEAEKSVSAETTARGESDYSTTNIQVEGVDEGDVLKTDGEYIYYARENSIAVVKAVPEDKMTLDYTIKYDEGFSPIEIYVDANSLVVIGQTYSYHVSTESDIAPVTPYHHMTKTQTTAITYDISDKTDVKKMREVIVDGGYLSSRKIGSTIYMTSVCHLNNLYVSGGDSLDIIQPTYKDTAKGAEFVDIGYEKIYYFPDMAEKSYIMITSFDAKDENAEANINTYLGGGGNIYVSENNMYVATVNYNYGINLVRSANISIVPDGEGYQPPKTTIYKFALSDKNVDYVSKAYVNGTVLNQFSMDEHNGFFRVAVTSNSESGQFINNILIFDKNMNETGIITDIAPGEKIYSARFMGNRGYMVTFQTVDPLFAMDLSDPYNPKILGALKIPGYSDYLHPYDENHLIGFGKDTVEDKSGDFAYYLGMKISLFDVTDITAPVEMFTEYIGDRGTESELLHNHRALLFSKEKSLLAFPVELHQVSSTNKSDKLAYGEFKGQFAYIYNIDIENGFALRGTISHLYADDNLKSGMYNGNQENYVRRILYIGDTLYTVSNGQIRANGMSDLAEKGKVTIK